MGWDNENMKTRSMKKSAVGMENIWVDGHAVDLTVPWGPFSMGAMAPTELAPIGLLPGSGEFDGTPSIPRDDAGCWWYNPGAEDVVLRTLADVLLLDD